MSQPTESEVKLVKDHLVRHVHFKDSNIMAAYQAISIIRERSTTKEWEGKFNALSARIRTEMLEEYDEKIDLNTVGLACYDCMVKVQDKTGFKVKVMSHVRPIMAFINNPTNDEEFAMAVAVWKEVNESGKVTEKRVKEVLEANMPQVVEEPVEEAVQEAAVEEAAVEEAAQEPVQEPVVEKKEKMKHKKKSNGVNKKVATKTTKLSPLNISFEDFAAVIEVCFGGDQSCAKVMIEMMECCM